MCVCVRSRGLREEASVTDSAEAAVKGSSNTAAGEEIGAKKPEGCTLLEERGDGMRRRGGGGVGVEKVTEGRRRSRVLSGFLFFAPLLLYVTCLILSLMMQPQNHWRNHGTGH